jgi:transcriptional regulator with XRE-family HTH domain
VSESAPADPAVRNQLQLALAMLSCMDTSSLGHRLRAMRQARGLSQSQLAAMAGVDRSHIYNLELGITTGPSFVLLGALAAVLGVPPSWLVGREPVTADEPQSHDIPSQHEPTES